MAELKKHQDKDGSFRNDSGTSFRTSLILLCLHALKANHEPKLKNLIDDACDFLLKEKSPGWTWNYWKRNSVQAKSKPYPDDLDDTSCALAALTLYRKEKVEGKGISAFARILIQQEQKVGGPYETWIIPSGESDAWKDIDPAVNANIAYVLGLHGASLPSLSKMASDALTESRYQSKYYHSPLSVNYFIARSHKGPAAEAGTEYLLEELGRPSACSNPLHLAFILSSLVRISKQSHEKTREVSEAIKTGFAETAKLLEANSWKAHPFYVEESKSEIMYSGSIPLTIAFVVEAHALCAEFLENESARAAAATQAAAEAEVLHRIIEGASARFLNMPVLQEKARACIDAMTRKDPGNQIALMSWHFEKALSSGGKNKNSTPDPEPLGIANVHGWLAYKIYDDILDDEGGADSLPIANVSLREACKLYESIMPDSARDTFFEILDGIDRANAWERAECRKASADGVIDISSLPDYGRMKVLADKSMGHALGPMAILASRGHGPESPEGRSLLSFFRHYIIARQINDDAHDWLEDLERGFLNSASSMLLASWKASGNPDQLDIRESRKELQKLFWNKTIDRVCDAMERHSSLAKKHLAEVLSLKDTTYMASLLAPIDASAKKARKDRDAAMRFLRSY